MSEIEILKLGGEIKTAKVLEFKAQPKKTARVVESFEQLMKRNQENQERLRKERNSANLSVIRSHQLKK